MPAILCLFTALLGACGGGDPPAPEPASGAGAHLAALEGVADLAGLMQRLEARWMRVCGELARLEAGRESVDRRSLGEQVATLLAMVRDERFTSDARAVAAALSKLQGALEAGATDLAAPRSAVESSCFSCHAALRDGDPATVKHTMQRLMGILEQSRRLIAEIEGAPADARRYGQLGYLAGELQAMAGTRSMEDASARARYAELRAAMVKSAGALRASAAGRDREALLLDFAALSRTCLECHEFAGVVFLPQEQPKDG